MRDPGRGGRRTSGQTCKAGGSRLRIAVNTGGGDAPGLNAVIRAVTVPALRNGWEVTGIRQGYGGLIDMTPEKGLIRLGEA